MDTMILILVIVLGVTNLAMANILVNLKEKFDTIIQRQDDLERKQRNLDL